MFDPYRQGMHDETLEQAQERLNRWVSEEVRARVNAVAQASFIFTADSFQQNISIEIPAGTEVYRYEFQERGYDSWWVTDRNPGDPWPVVTNEELEAKMLELWERHNTRR